eukprot:evm.model.scf_1690.2 EVM.evm.TU.scf_1690.2   scf_1690:6450-10078(-)
MAAPADGSPPQSLEEAREALPGLPHYVLNEIPGRPHVVYELRDYSGTTGGGRGGADRAREEVPFLFKPFEVGQAPPPKSRGDDAAPRQATIHEYLDWTITAEAAGKDGGMEKEQDFAGFRVIALLSRFRPGWPAPGAYESEGAKGCQSLGAPKNPLPLLLVEGKPMSAATIRSGRGFLEVPFFATREGRRGKGFGRCLLEAIEDVARACRASRLLLCSTDDEDTKATWRHLGFVETRDEDLDAWDVGPTDLLHMTNTVQMHKDVGPPPHWKSLVIRHESFLQRSYYAPNESSRLTGQSRNRDTEDGNSATKCSPNKLQCISRGRRPSPKAPAALLP